MGYYTTFVVRIWCKDTGIMSKGYVQHVSTQEQRYILDMDDLLDFIRGHLSPPTDDIGIARKTSGECTLAENIKDVLKDGR